MKVFKFSAWDKKTNTMCLVTGLTFSNSGILVAVTLQVNPLEDLTRDAKDVILCEGSEESKICEEQQTKVIHLEADSLDLLEQTMRLFEKLKPILADKSGLSAVAESLTDSLNRTGFNINYSTEVIRQMYRVLISEKLK